MVYKWSVQHPNVILPTFPTRSSHSLPSPFCLHREPWTQYGNDSVVEYECHRYKIIQPHTSEPNWQPPATPALWARLPEEAHGQSNDQQNYGGQHQQQHPHQQQQSFVDQSGGGGGYQDQPQSGTLEISAYEDR